MTEHHLKIPELLAPAGGPDSLRAAISNGADAVYLGVESLNARRSADNFTLEGLAETCRLAHLSGVKVYLTLNVVILDSELAGALDIADQAWASGVDAIIVQDLGLLRAVRTSLPHVRVHASTQLNTHNSATVRLLADSGVSRVTLAREVSLAEIERFAAIPDVEVESFVHGALCMCYSGQCLMSSLIGRRSANRGMCAQPCRLPYELVAEKGAALEVLGQHLLSPKDLAGIAILDDLVRTGVSALKIEGRMKSPEYVALVTGVYRAALDRIAAAPEAYEVRDGERAVLDESFSRGFSEAYLAGERGNDMMSYRRPNNRGVAVGRVAATAPGTATIAFDAAVDAEDTIEFWTSAGRFAQEVGPVSVNGAEMRFVPAGAKGTIAIEHPVGHGDRVFRVRNAALAAAAQRTFALHDAEATVPLAFRVRVVEGEHLSVEVEDASGRTGAATGRTVERARTKAVTAEEVAEHVGRLGGTPYSVGSWDLTLSPDVGVGFSALHGVRRDAIAEYETRLLAPWRDRRRANPTLPKAGRLKRGRGASAAPAVVAVVNDAEAMRACLAAGADAVHVPTHALPADAPLPDGAVPLVPRIAHDREVASALRHAKAGVRVVCGNLGLVRDAARAGAQVEAHWSLNALNALCVAELAEDGASFVWLSPELSGRQLAQLVSDAVVPVGIGVFGRQEMMATEHCVLMAQGPCDGRCASCERRASRRFLRDRKGYLFPVVTDITGRSHVFNSVPLDLTAALPEILAGDVSALRLDLELETPEEAAAQVRRLRTNVAAVSAGREPSSPPSPGTTTSGHFFRGVL